jgi:hypothetical protein
MGHAPNGVTQGYIDQQATAASRLEAIAERVRSWLLDGKPKTESGEAGDQVQAGEGVSQ